MATYTTDAFKALALVANGSPAARWNFPLAAGSLPGAPGGLGTAVDLSYSFLRQSPADDAQPGFEPFTSAQQAAAQAVLRSYAEVAGLRFSLLGGDAGQLGFGNSSQPGAQLAFARFPDFDYQLNGGRIEGITAAAGAGNVWVNRFLAGSAYIPGTKVWFTLVHEIGHALGLKHPFMAPDDGFLLDATQANQAYTVMAYRTAPQALVYEVTGTARNYTATTRQIYPETPMLLDIAVLQTLYGANTSAHPGNDVYRWETNPVMLQALWDAGGVDTIDCSNQVLRCVVNLTPGGFSSIGLRQTDAEQRAAMHLPSWFKEPLHENTYDGSRNLAIARGCLIENATGGRAADYLKGNALANVLDGRGGADTLVGGGGNDTYRVDQTADLVREQPRGGIDVVLTRASYTLPAEVEQGRILASGAVDLSGNALGNLLFAGAGDNVIDGGAGADTVSYAYASAGVSVSLAVRGPQASGGSGSDTLLGIERLAGSPYADRLTGNAAANVLLGGAGNDRLAGGAGHDLLRGGPGNDRLSGGAGEDHFRFEGLLQPGTNRDRVEDFSLAEDVLELDHQRFGALGAAGALPADYFSIGPAAQDANDFVLFDPVTGALAYDADATGALSPVAFALLTPGLALRAAHLEIV